MATFGIVRIHNFSAEVCETTCSLRLPSMLTPS
jgi:hypothetical protein